MKKSYIFSIILLSMVLKLQAQDLIVTTDGDSIHCKITKTTKEYVHFTFKHNDEIRNTLLSVDQIAAKEKDYFEESELPAGYEYINLFPRFRFAVDGGWQYRTPKLADDIDPDWQEHFKKLKSGFHYDIQAAYFFTEMMGAELMVSQQLFSNSLGHATLSDDNGNYVGSGILKENIAFNYFGTNYLLRFFDSRKKNCWIFAIGLGYMGYTDRVIFDGYQFSKRTAATLGTHMSIGYDIGLSDDLALGFKISTIDGSFKNYKEIVNGITTNKTMPDKTIEGLNTIRLSVGLRFNK